MSEPNIQLVGIEDARDGKHKLVAKFLNRKTNRTKQTKFGAISYNDFLTFPADEREERKRLYRARHHKDNLEIPDSAGALSYYLLWNKDSLVESLADYLKRFPYLI